MSPTPPKRNLKRVHELVAALYDDDPKVMRQAAKALDGMGAEVMPSHIPDLTKALKHPEAEARYGVLCAFCKLGPHLLF